MRVGADGSDVAKSDVQSLLKRCIFNFCDCKVCKIWNLRSTGCELSNSRNRKEGGTEED
jgi:hypothetical protein